ncbi:hypothetical protein [Chryseobacterium sp. PET-29]|uniref:hypothetical protein n=1 Tax=Chryseobacterium sp. PET-29 TaxID=2983267 RepID=UPI0021E5A70F|nr:hypothetical protein [Chryseobacterium sp. PET-29]
MKIYTINRTKTSYQLFDDHQVLVGEVLFDYLIRKNIRVKINHQLYQVKYSGLFGNPVKFLDDSGKVRVMIDHSKNRMFYYGDSHTEIYDFKTEGWWHTSTHLLNQRDDRLLMSVKFKNLFFTRKYHMEIADPDFKHALVMLAFLCYNIEVIEN